MAKTPHEIERMIAQLGHDEREVLEYVLHGLMLGRKSYGELELDRDPRDWHEEAAEEHRDALIYLACAALARRNQRRREAEENTQADAYALVVKADELAALAAVGGLDNAASLAAKRAISDRLLELLDRVHGPKPQDVDVAEFDEPLAQGTPVPEVGP